MEPLKRQGGADRQGGDHGLELPNPKQKGYSSRHDFIRRIESGLIFNAPYSSYSFHSSFQFSILRHGNQGNPPPPAPLGGEQK